MVILIRKISTNTNKEINLVIEESIERQEMMNRIYEYHRSNKQYTDEEFVNKVLSGK